MASKTNGIIALVIIIAVVATLYFLYKRGFPLPKEVQDIFKFFESVPAQITNFFGDIGKDVNDALNKAGKDFNQFLADTNENLSKATKDITIVNPIDAHALANRGNSGAGSNSGDVPSSGISRPPTKQTRQTTTTKTVLETNLNTGSDKIVGQNKTINLVETLTFTEQAGYKVALAKQAAKKQADIQKDVKQYQVTQPNSKTVNEITQLGKVPNPISAKKSPLDILLGDLTNIFNKGVIPVFTNPIPLPRGVVVLP